MPVTDYIRPRDIEQFKAAAKYFDCWILVRRTNWKSLKYIGEVGYLPKRVDCPALTADCDIEIHPYGMKLTAGLVVDPTLLGFDKAFKSPVRLHSAIDAWEKFVPLVHIPVAGQPAVYFPQGKVYSVQMDVKHRHYGCVIYSSSGVAAAGRYIHGDYDLHAIVPRRDPWTHTRVVDRSEYFDVQRFLNRTIGVPMILPKDCEKLTISPDEPLDVFWPDGKVTESEGTAPIWDQMQVPNYPAATGAPGL